jgi:hypothetical protein
MDNKELAKNDYYSLQDLLEFKHLVTRGTFSGNMYKSISKCLEFLDNKYNETIKRIEENPWYKQELESLSEIKLKDLVAEDEEYDPNFKVSMHDVFGNNRKF